MSREPKRRCQRNPLTWAAARTRLPGGPGGLRAGGSLCPYLPHSSHLGASSRSRLGSRPGISGPRRPPSARETGASNPSGSVTPAGPALAERLTELGQPPLWDCSLPGRPCPEGLSFLAQTLNFGPPTSDCSSKDLLPSPVRTESEVGWRQPAEEQGVGGEEAGPAPGAKSPGGPQAPGSPGDRLLVRLGVVRGSSAPESPRRLCPGHCDSKVTRPVSLTHGQPTHS